jgi:hypothetical protein
VKLISLWGSQCHRRTSTPRSSPLNLAIHATETGVTKSSRIRNAADEVWQQVRAYLDGETDIELHSMYERLMSETRAVGAAVGGR